MTTGTLFIVTAPSGAGKTTLVRGLLAQDAHIQLSVSYTTRAPRPGEQQGVSYHFIDTNTFEVMRDDGDFLEWAEVHGNFYGTSSRWLENALASGRDVLLEIDWQGARQVRQHFPQAVGIFILPPSIEALEQRLHGRGQDSAEVIARRVAGALEEIRHVSEFEYAIINDQLAEAQADLLAIVRSQRARTARQQAAHQALFARLLG